MSVGPDRGRAVEEPAMRAGDEGRELLAKRLRRGAAVSLQGGRQLGELRRWARMAAGISGDAPASVCGDDGTVESATVCCVERCAQQHGNDRVDEEGTIRVRVVAAAEVKGIEAYALFPEADVRPAHGLGESLILVLGVNDEDVDPLV